MTAAKTLVIGSCVSRDTFEHLPAHAYELVEYVARQSLVSAFSPPVTLLEPPALMSPFQQRMAVWDYASHLPTLLESTAGAIDLILWDLTDERLGVYVLPDDTAVTRSVDMVAAGVEASVVEAAILVEFGGEAHFEMWSLAAADFLAMVQRHHPQVRLALIALPWAELTETGEEAPASFGVPAERANSTYTRYYDAVVAHPAVHVLGRGVDVRAAVEHPWGEAPFHYTPDTYRSVTADLGRLLADEPPDQQHIEGDPL